MGLLYADILENAYEAHEKISSRFNFRLLLNEAMRDPLRDVVANYESSIGNRPLEVVVVYVHFHSSLKHDY
jgi:hypothetical protein